MSDIPKYEETPYLQLRFIKRDSLTGDIKNETVEFEYNPETETFFESTGATKVRFGPKRGRKQEFPKEMWEERVGSYLNRRYEIVTTEKTEKKEVAVEGDFKRILNKAINTFVNSIIKANDEMIRESYTKEVDDIPKECLTKATDILIYLQKNIDTISVKEYNEVLKDFFIAFPMATSKKDNFFLIKEDRDRMQEVVSLLQEKVDTLLQILQTKSIPGNDQTVLEANDIEMRPVTDAEEAQILNWMSDQKTQYVEAFKVTNLKTEKRFNEYCEKESLTEKKGISHLWHGTGFENLWSIFKSGMYLNPELIKSGVRICGKAFGYGIYFAPYCRKSMSYTSCSGAMYRGGSGRDGYLLLFKVATGNPYFIYRDKMKSRPNHWEDFHRDHPDMHCTWAEAGQEGNMEIRRLCYDEVIVYQECQCTIEYVVHFRDINW